MGRVVRTSILAALVLSAPLLLIALGLPRFLAGLSLPDVQPVLLGRLEQQSIAPARLKKAQAALQSALPTDGENRLWHAEIDAVLAGKNYQRLDQARDLTVAGLAANPTNPRGWTLLCELDVALKRSDAARCLDTAFFIGPFDWFVARRRTALSVYLWPQLDSDTRDAAARRLHLMWQTPQLSEIDFAVARTGNGKAMLAQAFADDPEGRAQFDRARLGAR